MLCRQPYWAIISRVEVKRSLSGCPVMDSVAIPPALRWHQKLSFSFGHIQNDLCATMWFSLLLVFFQDVVGIAEKPAGYLLMWGQVVDAVCTPLIGYESDRITGCFGIPKRKSWHLVGLFVWFQSVSPNSFSPNFKSPKSKSVKVLPV